MIPSYFFTFEHDGNDTERFFNMSKLNGVSAFAEQFGITYEEALDKLYDLAPELIKIGRTKEEVATYVLKTIRKGE